MGKLSIADERVREVSMAIAVVVMRDKNQSPELTDVNAVLESRLKKPLTETEADEFMASENIEEILNQACSLVTFEMVLERYQGDLPDIPADASLEDFMRITGLSRDEINAMLEREFNLDDEGEH